MKVDAKIKEAQAHLNKAGIDGWLLYDFHRNNPLAHRFLEIPPLQMVSRRFFYWIPAQGEPVKIVHAIESHTLDAWPGEKKVFFSWKSLHQHLQAALKGKIKVAMEYSPENAIPYVSKVDGGTIDLIRSFGVEVVSSADFLLYFTSILDKSQAKTHLFAAQALDRIVGDVWSWIAGRLQKQEPITEFAVQQKIEEEFKQAGLVSESPPIVAVNAASADPHYVPTRERSNLIRRGDFILIDLWAKQKGERSVYGDITRVAIAAPKPSEKQNAIFHLVRNSQKAAVSLIQDRFAKQKKIEGWEVDDAARQPIIKAGYGSNFIHRTGHSIEVELHGSGTHMDNLEMHDTRPLLPGTCFSIEPGIYLPGEFGVRLEHDVYIDNQGHVHVTGGTQDEIRPLA